MELGDFCVEMQLLREDIITRQMDRAASRRAEEIVKACEKYDIHYMNRTNPLFPAALAGEDGPALIYYRGDLSVLDNPKRAAVIGTRTPTPAGKTYAKTIGRTLAEAGYTVVSGLALGCDTAGHRGCLDGGGKTVAFLPGGLDAIYPKTNQRLADEILQNGGCLISEYPPDNNKKNAYPKGYQFVARDRLQAMSSQAVCCSEFDAASGTLHTLKYAKQYGVPVLTSPAIASGGHFAADVLKENNISFERATPEKTIAYLENLK